MNLLLMTLFALTGYFIWATTFAPVTAVSSELGRDEPAGAAPFADRRSTPEDPTR